MSNLESITKEKSLEWEWEICESQEIKTWKNIEGKQKPEA